jgi:hypothetical protein
MEHLGDLKEFNDPHKESNQRLSDLQLSALPEAKDKAINKAQLI